MPLRVLHVASWFPRNSLDFDGVFVSEHVRCLGPYVEQVVVAPSTESGESPPGGQGYAILRPEVRPARGLWLLPYIRLVARAAASFRPDLVHAHVARPAGVAARWVASRRSVPYLITEHTGPFAALFDTSLPNRAAARWAIRGASVITAVSRAHAMEIAAQIGGVRPVVVPNVVDTRRFVNRITHSGPTLRLLCIGRLVQLKGTQVLLEALEDPRIRESDWSLSIVGAGPEEIPLRKRAAPFGDRIRFVGYQSPAEIPRLLSVADVLVMPSLKESFGVVIIEALAAGVPVLATRCGGPEDIVTTEVGRLVEPASSSALADGLAWMLENHKSFPPERLRTYAEKHFGFEAVALRLLNLYDRTLRVAQ